VTAIRHQKSPFRHPLGVLITACGGRAEAETLDAPRDFEAAAADLCGNALSGDPLPGPLREALIEGRSTFNPSPAERCLAQLRNTSCEPGQGGLGGLFPRLPGWCRQAYSGTMGSGDPCNHSAECRGDAYCRAESETSSVCRPRAPPGTTCESHLSCSAPDSAVPDCVARDDGVARCLATPPSR
jgi:hypothetical protein